MPSLSKNKNNKEVSKKEYQFTVRIPEKLKDDVTKRFQDVGFNSLAEYVRFLIANDVYTKKA